MKVNLFFFIILIGKQVAIKGNKKALLSTSIKVTGNVTGFQVIYKKLQILIAENFSIFCMPIIAHSAKKIEIYPGKMGFTSNKYI